MTTDELTTVATFTNTAEAELAKERLESEGVRAFVLDEQAAGVLPFMGSAMGGIRVQVPTELAERAKEILGG
jgi:hypothetical protein